MIILDSISVSQLLQGYTNSVMPIRIIDTSDMLESYFKNKSDVLDNHKKLLDKTVLSWDMVIFLSNKLLSIIVKNKE